MIEENEAEVVEEDDSINSALADAWDASESSDDGGIQASETSEPLPDSGEESSVTPSELGTDPNKPADDQKWLRTGEKDADEVNRVAAEADKPPVGLSPEAREAWKDVPASVKADIVKRENDYAKGIEKHRQAQESCPLPVEDLHAFHELWTGFNNPYTFDPGETRVSEKVLDQVITALTTVPDGFNLNRKVGRRLPMVRKAIDQRGDVDWPLAELLAYGTLLQEGLPVRLSGQDSVRGTFSHRHAAWYDTHSQEKYVPLNHISEDQASFCVYNSLLSEAAVLGFDYGYSLVEPNMLVLWEAQFGDFANGAQVIIDQFITPALDKWQRGSGIVMLLPHGYEGQGPEHSNAYLERYLTLCAEENIQVCNLTTPGQFFHALRRQLKRNLRRPLVIMSPKSLLRSKVCVSPVDELVNGRFREILDDPNPPKKARRLVFCSGKVYYDLVAGREKVGVDDVGIVRVEQFYPFNEEMFTIVTEPYRTAKEIAWVQEETANRGGWGFMMPHLQKAFPDHPLRYIGRGASASPATGSPRVHREQQQTIVDQALGD